MPKKTNRKDAVLNYYSWAIAYIDSTYMNRVDDELNKYEEYDQISAFIPTIKVLKKTFKGKQIFEEVPLLFNYGFFRIPRKFAIHYKFLEDLKNNVSCIYSWVKDPQKVMGRHPDIRTDGTSVYKDRDIMVATATSEEVALLVRDSFNYSAHDKEDLERLEPGNLITLRGYPWDGMQAEIIEINPHKQEVQVKIYIFNQLKEIKVSFDNVFFTIYHDRGYDDSITIKQSLDPESLLNKKSFRDYTKNQND